MNFSECLKGKKPILLDGAMGTELQRRGVPTKLPLWSAQALIDHPEVVQQIHQEYLEAGAEIITTNTFRTNVRTVKRAQIGQSAQELTRIAVELAQQACLRSQKAAFIAGSVAPVEDCYRPDLVPSDSELEEEHSLLAKYLKKSGVDLILVETMNTIREAAIATQASLETGLPVLISLTIGKDGHLLSGETLEEAATTLSRLGPSALLLNCFSPTLSVDALKTLIEVTSLPTGLYVNGLGQPDDGQGWRFSGEEKIEEYVSYAQEWLRLGAKIIGGCCGTTPEYTARLRRLIDSR